MAATKDYWIISGTLAEQEEEPSNPLQEPRGTGANSTVFWVTNNVVTGDWVQLPDVQPQHIEAACKIKKMLSGNLQAKVDSCPAFPGLEKHLLRAQLARIQHSTEIVPVGLYEPGEEEGTIKLADEIPTFNTEKMKAYAECIKVEALSASSHNAITYRFACDSLKKEALQGS